MKFTMNRMLFILAVCALSLASCKAGEKKSDPRTMMMGEPPVEWRLVTMKGTIVETPRAVILRLAKDGGVSGNSFVNNFFGSATASADGTIAFGKMGATMMAGEPKLMESEHEFFALLEQVNRYAVAGDTLTLKHGDETLMEFVRQVK